MNIQLSIDRIEDGQAVLKTKDNQNIIWPTDKLPNNATEGMVLNFMLVPDNKKEQDGKQLAKDILNEILNTNS